MFKSKPHGDIVRKLSKKIVDLKKTSLDRFKYLKTLIAIGGNSNMKYNFIAKLNKLGTYCY